MRSIISVLLLLVVPKTVHGALSMAMTVGARVGISQTRSSVATGLRAFYRVDRAAPKCLQLKQQPLPRNLQSFSQQIMQQPARPFQGMVSQTILQPSMRQQPFVQLGRRAFTTGPSGGAFKFAGRFHNAKNKVKSGAERWGRYYETHPKMSTILTAIFVYFFGDAAEQYLRNAEDEDIDFERSVKMAAIGAFSNGVLLRNWYNILDYLMPIRTKKTIAIKMVMDAFIWGPVCILLAVGGGQMVTGTFFLLLLHCLNFLFLVAAAWFFGPLLAVQGSGH